MPLDNPYILRLPVAVIFAFVTIAATPEAPVPAPLVIAPVDVLIVPLVLSSAILVPESAELLVILPPVV